MSAFNELLERAGARPPRSGRGKWRCPKCPRGKSLSLSVDRTQELFHCFRCGWSGGLRGLQRELGIEPRMMIAPEARRRQAIRREATKFQGWWREKLNCYLEALWAINDLERQCRIIQQECLSAEQEIPEWVFGDMEFVMQNWPYFEREYDLFMDPQRNGEQLLQRYRGRLKTAA